MHCDRGLPPPKMLFFSVTSCLAILVVNIHVTQSSIVLKNFNEIFLSSYQQARSHLLTTIDPLIIVNGGMLTQIHRAERTNTDILPLLYQNLKAVSHIPFSIYLYLFDVDFHDRHLSSDQFAKLQTYLREIHRVRKSLAVKDFALQKDIFRNQLSIIDLSIRYLRVILRTKRLNTTALDEFCRKSNQLFAINLKLSVNAQLDKVHSTVHHWYTNTLNATERENLHILIIGPKPAREGYVMRQYFHKLLGNDKQIEGKRLLFVENLYDEPAALNVFGSWLLDAHAAGAFFDDRTRLHRDLLMADASRYLETLFP